jgi:hypothetical protein
MKGVKKKKKKMNGGKKKKLKVGLQVIIIK